MPRSIVVCDAVQLFREGVARVLDASRFEVILSVRSLDEIVGNLTLKRNIDLIILGVGEDALLDRVPLKSIGISQLEPLVVVLAASPTRAIIRDAMASGVRAVLSKDISGEILSSALELVLFGHKFYPAYDDPIEQETIPGSLLTAAGNVSAVPDRMQVRLAASNDSDDIQLSEREEQILCRLISGAPNKSIARDLAITDSTVKVHIKGLLRKLRVTNRTQAAIWGVNHGFSGDRRMGRRAHGIAPELTCIRAAS